MLVLQRIFSSTAARNFNTKILNMPIRSMSDNALMEEEDLSSKPKLFQMTAKEFARYRRLHDINLAVPAVSPRDHKNVREIEDGSEGRQSGSRVDTSPDSHCWEIMFKDPPTDDSKRMEFNRKYRSAADAIRRCERKGWRWIILDDLHSFCSNRSGPNVYIFRSRPKTTPFVD